MFSGGILTIALTGIDLYTRQKENYHEQRHSIQMQLSNPYIYTKNYNINENDNEIRFVG